MNCCSLGGRKVPGEGALDPRIVLIGEAPGAVEEQEGRPFVGPSGQLLRSALADLGIDMDEVYITNVVKCRPPGNRTPFKHEVEACRGRFDTELDATGLPEWYVFVGKTAAEACLGGSLLMRRVVNKPMRWRGTRALVIYHPAAVLRDNTLRARFLEGLRLLKPPNISKQVKLC